MQATRQFFELLEAEQVHPCKTILPFISNFATTLRYHTPTDATFDCQAVNILWIFETFENLEYVLNCYTPKPLSVSLDEICVPNAVGHYYEVLAAPTSSLVMTLNWRNSVAEHVPSLIEKTYSEDKDRYKSAIGLLRDSKSYSSYEGTSFKKLKSKVLRFVYFGHRRVYVE